MPDTAAKRSSPPACREPNQEPPCLLACPIGIDIPRYLRLISQGRFADALAVIVEKLPLPSVCGRVCPAPCETKCRLGEIGGSTPIRALKRFVTEQASVQLDQTAAKSTGKRVAIIGSGPAGLTASYYLAKLGHKVTVFEALGEPGGMVRLCIPDYRLPKNVLTTDIEAIKAVGVDIITNTRISSIDELSNQGYDAVFVAIGAHKPVKLDIDGEDIPGVVDGISLLKDINQGKEVKLGGCVAVIGGGNAAIDSARVAMRAGAKEAIIFYRRSREDMPANRSEVSEALLEGVRIEFLVAPTKITKVNNMLRMACIRMKLGKEDDSGRRRPEPMPESEFNIDVDTVITAIGQIPDIPGQVGLLLTKDGVVEASTGTLETGKTGVFAGGDAVTGPASVIEAVAAGRKAAGSIDKYLGGAGAIDETLSPPEGTVMPLKPLQPVGQRAATPSLPLDERLGSFAEVEVGFTEQTAMEQAARCLRCDLPITVDASQCAGCMTCVLRCSFRVDGTFDFPTSRVQINRLINQANEFEITFTDACDACGICVRYCPYGALTRQKVGKEV